MVCNNNWYLFFRLHHILCERLTKMYNQAVIIASEESKDKKDRKECTAVALRLKPKSKLGYDSGICLKVSPMNSTINFQLYSVSFQIFHQILCNCR